MRAQRSPLHYIGAQFLVLRSIEFEIPLSIVAIETYCESERVESLGSSQSADGLCTLSDWQIHPAERRIAFLD